MAASDVGALPAFEPGLVVASRAGRWVLTATILGSALAGIDATVVGIALPTLGRDFHAGLSSLQWVVTSYTLTLAGWLLVAGSLGDRYGRRRVFIVGVAWFVRRRATHHRGDCEPGDSDDEHAAANASTLIAARALQGVGG